MEYQEIFKIRDLPKPAIAQGHGYCLYRAADKDK